MTINPAKYKGTKPYLLVYGTLIRAAQACNLVTYSEIAEIMKLPPTGNFMQNQITSLLEEISREEISYGRPMLSALAKSKNKSYPSKGFFVIAKELEIYKGEGVEDDKQFWQKTLEEIYSTWKD